MREFVNLHLHTTFSFRDAYGRPSQHAAQAAETGAPALAITDHGGISGWVQHQKACNEMGVKPLFGCEFYAVRSVMENEQRKQHLTVLAKDLTGLRNIMALVSRSWTEGFYYKPTIDYGMLHEHKDGLLVLSGCMYGAVSTALWRNENYAKARSRAKWFQKHFGNDFFLEIQGFNIPEVYTAGVGLMEIGSELGIPLVFTNDVHYPSRDDARARELLLRVTPGWTPDNTESDLSQLTRKEALAKMKALYPREFAIDKRRFSEYLDNTVLAASRCDVELPSAEPIHYIPNPGSDLHYDFRKAVKRGWKRRGLGRMPDVAEYKARLKREMGLIESKGFADYLMVVADVITWAKSQGIMVGPARGSSSGSLVCYLLYITEVDPVRWGLLFERFIDLNRLDPPDIDTDFEDERRTDIHRYLAEKYGEERVAALGTFAKYKPKNALDDIARAYHIPSGPVETIKGFVIERASADARASMCLIDTIEAFPAASNVVEKYPDLKKAAWIEGQYRQSGKHACGVIIGEEPLNLHTALTLSGDKSLTIAYDGDDAAALGFLKLDILGLRALTIISEVLTRIGKTPEWLYALPFDDEETYQGFAEGDLTGVFQFTGQSTMSVCKQMPPINFMEIADINALSRPGPLHSGSTTIYIAARNGEAPVKKYHPIYDEITKNTWGVIVYQEQIMEVGRKLAGLSWEEVSLLRKIISKKLGVEGFNKHEKAFIDGAKRENDVPEAVAKEIWANICTHGSWSFNKSHAVAYGYISYLMMYLKRHHRLEYFRACLLKETADDKRMRMLRDFMNEGGSVLPVHLNRSGASWEIDEKEGGLRPGLMEIKGIGDKIGPELIKHQPYEDEADIRAKCDRRTVHMGIIRIMHARGLLNPDGSVGKGDEDVWGLRKLKASIENLPITKTIAECGWGRKEFVIVAGKITEHNIKDIYEVAYSKRGVVLDKSEVKDPELSSFINITLEDHTDSIYVSFDRWVYPRVREIIFNEENESDDVFLIKGEKTPGFRKINAKTIINISLQEREEMEMMHK